MKRTYSTGTKDDVEFFTGWEVEKTPAFGLHTLFVTGVQAHEDIETHYDKLNCEHIFFGANHSFSPQGDNEEWEAYEEMIVPFLEQGYLCTLDMHISDADEFTDSRLSEYHNFIPQIRVPIPYAMLWNYHTTVKIDDADFDHSNPGVWCHSLHDLMDRDKFTDWRDYTLDKPV